MSNKKYGNQVLPRTKDFLESELKEFNNFKYTVTEQDKVCLVQFTEVFGDKVDITLTFSIDNNRLEVHNRSDCGVSVELRNENKFFWIELLTLTKDYNGI